jgi:hypothetical protein
VGPPLKCDSPFSTFLWLFVCSQRKSPRLQADSGREWQGEHGHETQPRKLDHVKCEFSQTDGKKAGGWLRRDTKKNLPRCHQGTRGVVETKFGGAPCNGMMDAGRMQSSWSSRNSHCIGAVAACVTKWDDARRRAIAQTLQIQFEFRRAIPTIDRDRTPNSARSEL